MEQEQIQQTDLHAMLVAMRCLCSTCNCQQYHFCSCRRPARRYCCCRCYRPPLSSALACRNTRPAGTHKGTQGCSSHQQAKGTHTARALTATRHRNNLSVRSDSTAHELHYIVLHDCCAASRVAFILLPGIVRMLTPHEIINQHCQDLAYIANDLKTGEGVCVGGGVTPRVAKPEYVC